MSKPNPRQDPIIKIILQAAARGRVILAQRKDQVAMPSVQVQTPKNAITENKSIR